MPRMQLAARRAATRLAAPIRALDRLDRAVLGDRAVRRIYRARGAVTLLLVAIAFTGTLVHLDRLPEQREQERARREAASEQDVRRPGQGPSGPEDALAGGAQVIGPGLGQPLEEYVAQRRAALSQLDPASEPRVAVVSLREYVTPEQVLELLPDDASLRFAQIRLPAEGLTPVETEVIGGDLAGSIERAIEVPIAELAAEEEDARTLLESGTVEDEEFRRDLQLRVEELAAVRSLVNSGSGLIFAVVIEASVEDLLALSEAESVRLVDVGAPETDPDNSGFFGLLPEDAEVATYGEEGW
ncbi:MAG: hypothetical protein KY469_03820 [Actinobacteria bacterium]|nr:hypothetical protein [Actinomycetota bacterium]